MSKGLILLGVGYIVWKKAILMWNGENKGLCGVGLEVKISVWTRDLHTHLCI